MTRANVFIPAPHDGSSDGVYVTASEVRDVITSKDHRCEWETSRRGQLEPCGKDAVAIRWDINNHVFTGVCKGHAHGMVVPLAFIVEVAREVDQTIQQRLALASRDRQQS